MVIKMIEEYIHKVLYAGKFLTNTLHSFDGKLRKMHLPFGYMCVSDLMNCLAPAQMSTDLTEAHSFEHSN